MGRPPCHFEHRIIVARCDGKEGANLLWLFGLFSPSAVASPDIGLNLPADPSFRTSVCLSCYMRAAEKRKRRAGARGPRAGGRGREISFFLPSSHAGRRGREGGLSECGRCVMGNNIPPQKVVCTNTTLSPRVSRSAPHSTPRNIPIRHSHRLFLASQLQRYARYLQYVAAYITRIMDHVSHPGKNEGNAA